MRKGKIVLIPFPFTDISGRKVRPAVVLSVDKKGEDCICAFISSAKTGKGGMFNIEIKATKQNGLKIDSVLKVNKIATLQKKIVIGELGELGTTDLKKIESLLKKLFTI